MRPLLNDVVKEVVLCLRYYGVTFRGHPPAMIMLAGGDGLEPNLDKLLQQACKIPVSVDDPRGTLSLLMPHIQLNLNRSPGPMTTWSTALGLSLRGLSRARRRKPTVDPIGEAAA